MARLHRKCLQRLDRTRYSSTTPWSFGFFSGKTFLYIPGCINCIFVERVNVSKTIQVVDMLKLKELPKIKSTFPRYIDVDVLDPVGAGCSDQCSCRSDQYRSEYVRPRRGGCCWSLPSKKMRLRGSRELKRDLRLLPATMSDMVSS